MEFKFVDRWPFTFLRVASRAREPIYADSEPIRTQVVMNNRLSTRRRNNMLFVFSFSTFQDNSNGRQNLFFLLITRDKTKNAPNVRKEVNTLQTIDWSEPTRLGRWQAVLRINLRMIETDRIG